MSAFTLLETIPVHNTLGECILWDERAQCVWWTDIQNAVLYRYAQASSALQQYALPERLCSFGFIEGEDARLVCAFESGFALYDPTSAELSWLYRPEEGFEGTRFNDGRVDRQGRFWSGTMVEGEARDAAGRPTRAGLYWISATGHRKVLGDIEISNSLCFSRDGTVVYFADSPTRRIMAYDLDPPAGELGTGRTFAEVSGDGAPDGSIIDVEDCLWNARWGGSKIVRHTPGGDLDCELDLPVSQPTCVCFGGRDLNRLFVSTAREGLSAERLDAEPEAGNVLVYKTHFRGLPEDRFCL
jgi:L-arabinonolactonase